MKMNWNSFGAGYRVAAFAGVLAVSGSNHLAQASRTVPPQPIPQEENELFIINDSELPETYPQARYEVRLAARGGTTPLRWHLEKGTLPPGIKLEGDGFLHGSPESSGEFQFTISVKDNSRPEQGVEKHFILRIQSALTLEWKNPARVNGNRIEGSVEVSNKTPDDVDLTFIVLAVAANGRATAIGYQHFVVPKTTLAKELPFGETLPNGAYVVHVDVVGEVAPKHLIYRKRLQTSAPLQVQVGP